MPSPPYRKGRHHINRVSYSKAPPRATKQVRRVSGAPRGAPRNANAISSRGSPLGWGLPRLGGSRAWVPPVWWFFEWRFVNTKQFRYSVVRPTLGQLNSPHKQFHLQRSRRFREGPIPATTPLVPSGAAGNGRTLRTLYEERSFALRRGIPGEEREGGRAQATAAPGKTPIRPLTGSWTGRILTIAL